MGLTDNIKNLSQQLQQSAKNTSISLTQRTLRIISGFFIGLVLALITQELMHTEVLMFLFLTTLISAIIYKLLARLQIFQILIFDLICVLIGILLRMYIMIAP